MTDDALFPDDTIRVPVAELTAGERLRNRQGARIMFGCHPLSINGVCIPLHPDAPRDAQQVDGRDYPRCGTCRFRVLVGGHARDFPKCLYGYDGRSMTTAVRAASSQATDVRAWWPACEDYSPQPPTPNGDHP